jgi:predicted metal-binding protein
MIIMVRKVVESVPDDVLKQDLEKYRQMAIALGATDAKIITTDTIVIDERVRAKCIIPLCPHYGATPNCPPYAVDLDFMRKVINKFQYGIFYLLKLLPQEVAGPEYKAKKLGLPSAMKSYEISTRIESEAFYDSYYLAVGFSNASCKPYLCSDEDCSALIPGQH